MGPRRTWSRVRFGATQLAESGRRILTVRKRRIVDPCRDRREGGVDLRAGPSPLRFRERLVVRTVRHRARRAAKVNGGTRSKQRWEYVAVLRSGMTQRLAHVPFAGRPGLWSCAGPVLPKSEELYLPLASRCLM